MKDEKIIMYDSPEAGRLVTVTAWEIDNPNGIIYTKDEKLARYNNCTHKLCACGKAMKKYRTMCDDCGRVERQKRWEARPFKEYDPKDCVCIRDDDKYFWDEQSIIDYILEHNEDNPDDKIYELELEVCVPVYYNQIDYENIAPECHEDWEPSKELEKKLDEFNSYLKNLKPHSWTNGKVRTIYKIDKTITP